MNRKNKSVSFNLSDKFEAKLLSHADDYSCFSTYVKRLIQNDMQGSFETDRQVKNDRQTHSNVLPIKQPEPPYMKKELFQQLL